MRILVDVRLLAKGGRSGIEEYTHNLLRSLLTIDRDNDYTLFYNGFRKQPLKSFKLQNSGFKIIDWKIPNKILDAASRFLSWPKLDAFIKTDLIFSPHFNILAPTKTPRVITFHDLSFVHHPRFFSRKQRWWHWFQNIKTQAVRADHIIAVSQFTKNDLVDTFGLPPEKISVIYSGISEEFRLFSSKDDGMAASIVNDFGHTAVNPKRKPIPAATTPIIPAAPYILYLGTLEPRKNIRAVIRAFNSVKSDKNFADFKLVLAGRPGWLYDAILKEIANSPYRKDIVLPGQIEPTDRPQLYARASVFVYPSFFEGFGFPPLEAQVCGCPVIVSNRGSLPEIIGDSGLMAEPWAIEAIADAIKKIAGDHRLRQNIVSRGLQNAKRFNWPDAARQTLKTFTQI